MSANTHLLPLPLEPRNHLAAYLFFIAVAEQLSRHPYEDQSQFAPGRRRLDFCDVSHYEKIILKNWAQFEEFLRRKEEFQRHMAAYRTLRNCVQHNREPSDIEQKNGEAAMTWLERVLDRYEQETLTPSEEEEELTIAVVASPGPGAHQVEPQNENLAERQLYEQEALALGEDDEENGDYWLESTPDGNGEGSVRAALLRGEFWTQLLERAKEKTSLHAGRSPTTNSSLNAGAGKAGIVFQYRVRMDSAEVALRIRRDTVEESKRIFDSLYANGGTIEQAFGNRLEWLRCDDVRNSRIRNFLGWAARQGSLAGDSGSNDRCDGASGTGTQAGNSAAEVNDVALALRPQVAGWEEK